MKKKLERCLVPNGRLNCFRSGPDLKTGNTFFNGDNTWGGLQHFRDATSCIRSHLPSPLFGHHHNHRWLLLSLFSSGSPLTATGTQTHALLPTNLQSYTPISGLHSTGLQTTSLTSGLHTTHIQTYPPHILAGANLANNSIGCTF